MWATDRSTGDAAGWLPGAVCGQSGPSRGREDTAGQRGQPLDLLRISDLDLPAALAGRARTGRRSSIRSRRASARHRARRSGRPRGQPAHLGQRRGHRQRRATFIATVRPGPARRHGGACGEPGGVGAGRPYPSAVPGPSTGNRGVPCTFGPPGGVPSLHCGGRSTSPARDEHAGAGQSLRSPCRSESEMFNPTTKRPGPVPPHETRSEMQLPPGLRRALARPLLAGAGL